MRFTPVVATTMALIAAVSACPQADAQVPGCGCRTTTAYAAPVPAVSVAPTTTYYAPAAPAATVTYYAPAAATVVPATTYYAPTTPTMCPQPPSTCGP